MFTKSMHTACDHRRTCEYAIITEVPYMPVADMSERELHYNTLVVLVHMF